jgi:hypothetical protein
VVVILVRFGAFHQLGALGIGGEHGLERAGGAARRFLCDVAQAATARHVDRAAIGLEHARDHAHQRGFSRPVAADQPDPPAWGQFGGRAVEDRAAAEAHGNIVEVEHRRRVAVVGASRKE